MAGRSGHRLTRIGHAYQTTAYAADGTFAGTADPLRTFTYAYDGYANRNRLTETWVDPAGTARSETQTFAFDGRDRLAAAAYADEALSYAYDANGNRTHEHRYAPVTGWTAPDYLDQTAQGPLGSRRYVFDGRDRLTEVRDALDADRLLVGYGYDASGRTLSRTEATATGPVERRYRWNADDSLRRAEDGAQNALGDYAYAAGGFRETRSEEDRVAHGNRRSCFKGPASRGAPDHRRS